MQAIDRIKERTKSLTSVQSIATHAPLRIVTSFSQALPLLSNNNNSFLRLSNSF